MEPNSQLDVIEAQIRECYARVVYTHKVHEKCSDILNKWNNRVKFWQIALSALTTSGIVGIIIVDEMWLKFVTAGISFITTFLSTYVKKYDLGGLAQQHADAAVAIWNVREKYLSLITDMLGKSIAVDEARGIRDELQHELLGIYNGSPRSFAKAYNEAVEGLKKMDEMTFTDDEINKFLPQALRKMIQE